MPQVFWLYSLLFSFSKSCLVSSLCLYCLLPYLLFSFSSSITPRLFSSLTLCIYFIFRALVCTVLSCSFHVHFLPWKYRIESMVIFNWLLLYSSHWAYSPAVIVSVGVMTAFRLRPTPELRGPAHGQRVKLQSSIFGCCGLVLLDTESSSPERE